MLSESSRFKIILMLNVQLFFKGFPMTWFLNHFKFHYIMYRDCLWPIVLARIRIETGKKKGYKIKNKSKSTSATVQNDKTNVLRVYHIIYLHT